MIVTDPNQFTALLEELKQAPAVAVDTEFLWTKTYEPRLALVQFSGNGKTFAMDPLSITDFTAFKTFLEDPSVIKIFHACEQDLMILEQCCDAKVYPLFDTQVGMALCGYAPQVSYRFLVEEFMDISLDKGSQFSDWLKRPLSPKQEEYALNDVSYLIECYPKVLRKLEEAKRVKWFNEDMCLFTDDSFYEDVPDEERYRKVKGAGRLKQRNLALLRSLTAWREEEGRKRDLRPRMIFKDDILLNICYGLPKTMNELRDCRIPPHLIKNFGREMLELSLQAQALSQDELPDLIKGEAPTDRFRKDFAKFAKVLDAEAEKLGIDPQVLMSRKKARAILYKSQEEKEVNLDTLTGWRADILTAPLTEIIETLI